MKSIRLYLGLTQRDVSRILYPTSDNNIVGSIESNFKKEKYTNENLVKLARAFSLLDPTRTYTIYDFYPEKPLQEEMVSKAVIASPTLITPTVILTDLLENQSSFFEILRSINDITEHCNLIANKNWKTTDFTSVIARAEQSGKLIRDGDSKPKYKKA